MVNQPTKTEKEEEEEEEEEEDTWQPLVIEG